MIQSFRHWARVSLALLNCSVMSDSSLFSSLSSNSSIMEDTSLTVTRRTETARMLTQHQQSLAQRQQRREIWHLENNSVFATFDPHNDSGDITISGFSTEWDPTLSVCISCPRAHLRSGKCPQQQLHMVNMARRDRNDKDNSSKSTKESKNKQRSRGSNTNNNNRRNRRRQDDNASVRSAASSAVTQNAEGRHDK